VRVNIIGQVRECECVLHIVVYTYIYLYIHTHSYQRARSKCGCSEISFFLKFAPIKTHFCKTKPFNLNRLEQIGRNKTEWSSSTRWCLGNGHASGDTPATVTLEWRVGGLQLSSISVSEVQILARTFALTVASIRPAEGRVEPT